MTASKAPPQWENFPRDLVEAPHWVLWKSGRGGQKVPVSPAGKAVDVTDRSVGWPLPVVRNAFDGAKFAGVGFVLRGKGIVAADLDDCVQGGVPTSAALSVLQELGAGYVEFSPSGQGLRAFGLCEGVPSARGRRFEHRSVKLELYADARYVTVTGRVLDGVEPGGWLKEMPGFAEVLASPRAKHSTEEAEETEAAEETEDAEDSEVREVAHASMAPSALSSLTAYPRECLPTAQGMRHDAVFQLARFLKSVIPNGTEQELRAAVSHWHARVVSVIGTKDFGVTWAEFVVAWQRVRFPLGHGHFAAALNRLPERLPSWMQGHPFGPIGEHLLKICVALAELQAPEPFFLGCRTAGKHVGCHETHAATLLKAMVATGYLELVVEGGGNRASRYRLGTARKGVFSGPATNPPVS